MIPPIFPLISASVTVLGSNPVRFYPHGQAPQGVTKPYALWQTVTATPENYLGQTPDVDGVLIQIDVWGDSASSVSNAADQIRGALEPHMHMTTFGNTERDAATQLYRYRMDFSYWVTR
jgi:hypothetical protein